MNPVLSIVLGIIMIIVVISTISYMLFPRQTVNFYMTLAKRKRYVVCHMRYANTEFENVYLVVPESDYITQVNKFAYMLNPKYAVFSFNKRLHYVLQENNLIPLHFTIDSKEEILFQAMETQNALNNDVTEYLFTKRKEILIIGLFIVAILSVLVMAFCVMKLNEVVDKVNSIGQMMDILTQGKVN